MKIHPLTPTEKIAINLRLSAGDAPLDIAADLRVCVYAVHKQAEMMAKAARVARREKLRRKAVRDAVASGHAASRKIKLTTKQTPRSATSMAELCDPVRLKIGRSAIQISTKKETI